MDKREYHLHISTVTLFIGALMSRSAQALPRMNLSPGVTPISQDIYHLHMLMLYICVAIGVLVFGVMFYSIVKHRKSKGAKADNFHDHLWVEIAWTVIPTIILVIMAIPAIKVLRHMDDSSKADINIKVTGYQWKWRYDYLDEGIAFNSNLSTPPEQYHGHAKKGKWYLLEVDRPLVVPTHKKIRFLLTSNDVIHSWWVPELGVKMDAMPGSIHAAWTRIDKAGTYRGQCTELCGMNHGFMPIVVIAKPMAEYQAWLKAQKVKKQAQLMSQKPTTVAKAMPAPKSLPQTTQAVKATTSTPPVHSDVAIAAPEPVINTASTTSPATSSVPSAIHLPAKKVASAMTRRQLMNLGQSEFRGWCAQCHQSDGAGDPPVYPSFHGSKVVTGPWQQHVKLVLHGRDQTKMQDFSARLNDRQIAAIVTYQRNSWGNDDQQRYGAQAGGVIQPTDVAAVREQ